MLPQGGLHGRARHRRRSLGPHGQPKARLQVSSGWPPHGDVEALRAGPAAPVADEVGIRRVRRPLRRRAATADVAEARARSPIDLEADGKDEEEEEKVDEEAGEDEDQGDP